MRWIIIGLIAYAVLGVLTTFILSRTPYADNGWIVTTLLWPLFVLGFLGVLR